MSEDDGAVRCELAVETRSDGERRVAFVVGSVKLSLTSAEAHELGGDLIRFAIQIEDGGETLDTIGGWPVARDEMPTEPSIDAAEPYEDPAIAKADHDYDQAKDDELLS